jgi:hypothetical protein
MIDPCSAIRFPSWKVDKQCLSGGHFWRKNADTYWFSGRQLRAATIFVERL